MDNIPQSWRLLLSESELKAGVKYCADILNEKFCSCNEKIVATCILKGAIYFFADLTRLLKFPHSISSIECSSYHKQTQSTIQVGEWKEKDKFTKVILIDELCDSGTTMSAIRETIHLKSNIALNDIFTCTLFKKNGKAGHVDLFAFSVPNVWLVGYGLDDKQEKRNLYALYACPKEDDKDKSDDDELFSNDVKYEEIRSNLLKL